MKIIKLCLKNFRGIEQSEINFDGRPAVLFGINGMGKSTVLHACSLLFYRIFQNIVNSDLGSNGDYRILDTDIKIGAQSTRISAQIQLGDNVFHYYRGADYGGRRIHSKRDLRKICDEMVNQYIGEVYEPEEESEFDETEKNQEILKLNDAGIPVYATYSVNRYVTGRIDKIEKDDSLSGKLEAWRDIFNPTVNFGLFFEWFRGRQEYENSKKVECSTFADAQLSTVRRAILKILDNDFTDLKIRITDEDAQMTAVKHDLELSIAQLSEGEKCILAMAGDLARKLAIANPKRKNPLSGEGIVLIDEVDLHLHPTWQSKIMHLLIDTFPNIQFIVTTHSPKILGEITDEADIFEICEKDGNISIKKQPSMSGWDTNTILNKFMHTKAVNRQTEELIDQIFDNIDEGELDEAEKLVDKLAQMTDELNLNVVRARTLIYRKR